ncbi:conserved exported protein of unknown function [Rhodovastum atsumiense]|nr:PHB depolymerase family esterase [Rhodovastum atsumiense]CAH2601202.1 conserved exported protein of unknown function [Rhodovastum atsumiense]
MFRHDMHRRHPRRMPYWVATACLPLALLAASPAAAEWASAPEKFGVHPTWIYTPRGTLPGLGKRGLLVVLHGCAQTHDQLKEGGNIAAAAEKYGLVAALPYVTPEDGVGVSLTAASLGCWDYDGTMDLHGHAAFVADLAQKLAARATLNIDRDRIYVVGLSSGGALALKAACAAPDVFSGVGSIAGPSVGSDQLKAVFEVPERTVEDSVAACRKLAGSKLPFLATQIANIAFGTMDKDGWQQAPLCTGVGHPGQNCVSSVKWSIDDVKVLQEVYAAREAGCSVPVQGGKGREATVMGGRNVRIGILTIPNVGHAWPAGATTSADAASGEYIAHAGLNYPMYISGWLTTYSLRGVPLSGGRRSVPQGTAACASSGS